MPQLKQPLRLEEMSIRAHCKKYCEKCEKWMQDLLEVIPSGRRAYWFTLETVFKECRKMEEEISRFPQGLLKILSPRLAKEFATLICSYDRRRCQEGKGKEYISPCITVFRSVLTRFIQKIDIRITSYSIGQVIVIQNLDCLPGLLELYLDSTFKPDQSSVLASMIHHLNNLQIFMYHYDCTDEIIEQLRLHCPNLTELDFAYSSRVTNASVRHLMQLRKLIFFNLKRTQIDDEHYGLLLSELPNIANMEYWKVGGDILRHIVVERLDAITHVSGSFMDIDALILKCPNTTNIALYRNSRDVSGLTAFLALRVLEISYLDYDKSNLNAVLKGIGHRLTDLKVSEGTNVNLQDIITLCPSLVKLSLVWCSFLDLNANTPIDLELPHFRNLINLEINSFFGNSTDLSFIRYYASLKSIDLRGISIFSVEFVREILILGTFTQLEVLHVQEISPGVLTTDALQLLLRHCPHLKRIEVLGSCKHLSPVLIEEIKRGILLQNFDLEIKAWHKYTLFVL